MITKSDLINVNQLKDILALTSSTTEEYAKAFQEAMEIALEQPLVAYNDPSELLVSNRNFTDNPDVYVTTGYTYHDTSNDICNPTLMALQCKSCGGIIDKGTMTCRHCGMTYMLVSSSENP